MFHNVALSKILGLINLMEVDKTTDPRKIMGLLKQSCDDLIPLSKR